LADLLDRHDEDFVRNAYRVILRREPEPEGFERYLEGLRSGELSKREVLARLRYSPEGRARSVTIPGLLPYYVLYRALRVPVLGYLAAVGAYVIQLPAIARNVRRLEATSNATSREIAQQAKRITDAGETALRQVKRKADAAGLAALAHQVAALRERKAETATVAGLASEIAALNERKAEVTTVSSLATELVALRARKADVATLVSLANKVAALRAQKTEAAALTALASQIAALGERKADAEQLQEISARLAHFATRAELSDTQQSVEKLKGQAADQTRTSLDQERRLAALLEHARKQRAEPTSIVPNQTLVAEDDHLLDAFYAAFEDHFRGPREEIKRRVAVYLPLVEATGAGAADAPVLDVGCGRGEWLELLQEHGLRAQGVDMNRIMVMRCKELGLDVVETDALGLLRGLDANSLGAVTGFHIIEHLPYRTLISLFDETLRVLKPGGVAIFETPNPENLIVAACNFYYDPTHRHPLPPEPMHYLAETRGFERVEIKRLHPLPLPTAVAAELASTTIGEWFSSAQDYSVIGYKRKALDPRGQPPQKNIRRK
jgi:SAM-dependent methyltransferase